MKTNLKKSIFSLTISLVFLSVFISCSDKSELERKLSRIEGITEISKLDSDSLYSESYELWFTQNVDHENSKSESFKQRVILNHVGFDRPTVVILEGYGIYSKKAGELSKLLNANQISIEHRFFNDSKPDTIEWEYLTIKQAAIDQHKIIKALKHLYSKKWATTGISKGGQTTMYHRRFFPNDVDASIVYVAPFNFEREDPRISRHLKTAGTAKTREKIKNFQTMLFKMKDELFPMLEVYAQEQEYTFNHVGMERAYDVNVLEYSFAFWQWNGDSSAIPDEKASNQEIFSHWSTTAPFSFFYDQDFSNDLVFTYQALSEIGFYEYDIEPFKKYLSDTANITFDFKIPENINYSYHPESMQDINSWLQENGNFMLYLYGENDPWAATAINPSPNTISVKFVNPNGNHRTRIKSFPDDVKENIYTLLENWMNVKIKRKEIAGGGSKPGKILEVL